MPAAELRVTGLPAFTDNYLWMIDDGANAVAVDPGDAAVVQQWLEAQGYALRGILLTHHHPDHIGGVATLAARYPQAVVIGHGLDAHRLPPLSQHVADGDTVQLPGLDVAFSVIATPGHTLGHLSYYGEGHLFCGDTLFAAGCGRMFEGQPAQYLHSLQRLAALPAATQVFAAHEYTLANLAFARSLLPDDAAVDAAQARALQQRAALQPTLPSSISRERQHNLFLRCEDASVAAAVGCAVTDPVAVFAALRRAKDLFRST